MIYDYKGQYPNTKDAGFIAESADIAGDVTLAEGTSVWFNASIRADIAAVHIGKNSNIQDNAVVHVSAAVPSTIGKGVTIGHGAIIHACSIEDNCLIGMGAIILDKATIQKDSIVGAGALVTQNKTFPPASLILGNPAKLVRSLSKEEIEGIRKNAIEYVNLAGEYHRKDREN